MNTVVASLAKEAGRPGGSGFVHPDRPPAADTDHLLPALPYIGLRPFEKNEWPIFCGRERMVNELIEILAHSHLAFVLGASGSGKSSLVRAGMLATLEGQHGMVGVQWRTATMRPGGQPFLALSEALLDYQPTGSPPLSNEDRHRQAAALSMRLENADRGLEALLQHLDIDESENLLLLVDQFEEIFRYQAWSRMSEKRRFVEQLIEVSDRRPPGLYIVVTMRAEFLGDCASFPGLASAINRTHYLVPPMGSQDLREAIMRPAKLLGGKVEDELVERLVDDVAGQEDLLPILQHSLALMWNDAEPDNEEEPHPNGRVLSLERYEALKGSDESLISGHCERIYGQLGEPQQRIAQVMFRRMVQVDGRDNSLRRPSRIGTVMELAGTTLDMVSEVADAFGAEGASFVQIGRHSMTLDTSIDITHESLIRQWSRLRNWRDAERRSFETLRDLARAAARRSEDQGGVWSGKELAYALAWREEERPTEAWARRYEVDYAAAIRFLSESERDQVATQEAKRQAEDYEARRKEQELAREHAKRLADEQERVRIAEKETELQRKLVQMSAERERATADLAANVRRSYGFAKVGLAVAVLLIGLLIAACCFVEDARQQQKEAAKSANDATKIAVEARELSARLWTITGRAQLASEGAAGSILIALAFLNDGKPAPEVEALAYAGLQRLRERRSFTVMRDDEGAQAKGDVGSLSVWPDGTIASVGGSGILNLWARDGTQIGRPTTLKGVSDVFRVRFSRNGARAIVSSYRQTSVLKKDEDHLEPDNAFEGERLGFGGLSDDGRLAAVTNFQTGPALWDLDQHVKLWPEAGQEQIAGAGLGVAISGDASRFAYRQGSQVVIRSTTAPFAEYRRLNLPTSERRGPLTLAFRPGDPKMLVATFSNSILVWLPEEQQPTSLAGHLGLVYDAAFSPDGDLLATAGEDRSIRLWRVDEILAARGQAQSVVLRGHGGAILSLAFGSDSKWLVSGSTDRTIRVWDVETALPERSGSESTSAVPAGIAPSTLGPDAKRGDNLGLMVPTGFEKSVIVKVPYDFGTPAYSAVSADRRFVLVAPKEGRPLLYRVETPQAAVAELGEQRRVWDGIFFEGGDPAHPSGLSGGVVHSWRFFDNVQDMSAFARNALPFRDGQRAELSAVSQCLLSLRSGADCQSLPPNSAY